MQQGLAYQRSIRFAQAQQRPLRVLVQWPFFRQAVLPAKLMHMRHARHPAKEANSDLAAGRLHFQVLGSADLGKHCRFLPLDPSIFTFKLLARRIRRAVRPLLRLDALRLAAAQVDGYFVIDGAALGRLQLASRASAQASRAWRSSLMLSPWACSIRPAGCRLRRVSRIRPHRLACPASRPCAGYRSGRPRRA